MVFIATQRPFLANRCGHQLLPSSPLSWQQQRRVIPARSLRNSKFVCSAIFSYRFDEESPFERELLIVERRRCELESQLEACNRDPIPNSELIKENISYELKWLITLEMVIKFHYEKGRLPNWEQGTAREEVGLAQWMIRQQSARLLSKITYERVSILNSMPWWSWDPFEAAWQSTFEVLDYVKRPGKMPHQGQPSLGSWVSEQRIASRAGQACLNEETGKCKNVSNYIDQESGDQLESIPGWSWDPVEANWEANYRILVKFVAKHNRFPIIRHSTLGMWLNSQRQAYKAWKTGLNGGREKYKGVTNYMDEERADRLESIPGWSWDPVEEKWEANYQKVLKYVTKHNRIPPKSHPALRCWVNQQCMAYKAWKARLNKETEKYKDVTAIMNEERARKLESIPGWSWDLFGDD